MIATLNQLHQLVFFAQSAPAEEPAGDPYAFPRMLFFGATVALLFYLMILRPQKKKEQEMRAAVNNIKENDRVVTIGGIHGVVTNVRRDAEQVTIRVDETTGTKLRMNISAIARVLTAEEQAGGDTSGNKS